MLRAKSIVTLLLLALAAGCGSDNVPAEESATGGTGGGTGGTGGGIGGTGGDTGGTGGDAGGTGGGTGGTAGADGGVIDACEGIDAMRPTCQALPDRFDASTTLAKGCYFASKTPVIGAGVTLTLSPGVSIIFAEDTGLTVDADQALVAAGTADEPICLTGDVAQRGSWKGLMLGRTEGDADKLDYVTVEYAGSTKIDSEAAAIKAVSDSRPVNLSITNTTVRESEGYGLFLVASVDATAFAANTFTKNALAPVNVDSDVAGLLDSASDYTGNDVDEIMVRSAYLTKNATWRSLGVPYHLSANLSVEVPFTIDAPNTLIMGTEAWISTSGDDAALNAVGTATNPIVFTGEQKTRGYWDGLVFDGTNNADNRLDYVTVEYAGCTLHDVDGAGIKAVADSHGVTLTLTNTTIHESQGWGLYLAGSGVTPAFEHNTLTNNTLGPASVGSEAVYQLDATTTYTGNDLDHLRVRTNRVPSAVTWKDIGVPYELDGNLHVDLVWTLEPGVTLLMAQDSWISIDGDDAGFHAVGTAPKPITISGIEKTAGYWHSIRFGTTLNGANALENATVEYGGSTGGGGEAGMINATSDSHGVALSVKNSTIRDSGQYGIWLGGYAQYNDDIESSNTFSGNALGNVYRQP